MGWQDDPIVTPGAPAPQPWEKDAVVYPAQKKVASGVLEAAQSGYQSSVQGLASRGKLPDIQLDPTHSKWYERLAAGATQLAADFPLMAAGGVAGAAAGTAAAGPVGTVLGGGAGAFALPAALRESYIQAYSKGEITSSADFLNRAAIVIKHTSKEAAVGALTSGFGKAAGTALQTAGYGAKAVTAGTLGAEGTTLVVAPALMEGRLPEPQDFTDAAILLGGLKAVGHVSRGLQNIYTKTGKTPMEVMADAKTDPTILDDLKAGAPVIEAAKPAEQVALAASVPAAPIAPPEVDLFHGSPHEFSAFDPTKIGTGEGAQAFGQGLYLAESEPVAVYYRDVLSRAPDSLGSIANSAKRETANIWIEQAGGNREKAAADYKEFAEAAGLFDSDPTGTNELLRAIAEPEGNLYQIKVPKSAIENALDWDAPLSAQPQSVLKALNEILPELSQEMLGEEVVKKYGVAAGGNLEAELQKRGVTGISYLNGASRGGKGVERNYVIFPGNEHLLRITARNGKPVNTSAPEAVTEAASKPAEPAKAVEAPTTEYKQADLFTEEQLPRAYRELAREENARNAVADPSPEAAKFMEKPFADVPQLPGEPVLPTHVNYNYLNAAEDVKGAMSRLSELYETKVREATRGEVPWEQTYAEARQLFESATGEKAPALPLDNADYAKLSADLYARKQILISGAEQLMVAQKAYAEARAQGLANDQMKLELLAQIDRVAQAQAAVRGTQAEVGRALNILKSTNRDKAYYDELTKLIDGRFGVEGKVVGDANFDTMVDMLGQLGSPKEALKFAEKASRATTWEKIVEAWKAGLVSGPVTQVANILGNVTFMTTRPLVDVVAVASSALRSPAERMSAVEPLARITGNIQGTIDGAKVAWAVLKTGEFTGKTEASRKAIGGTAGEVVRTPFRLLSAADAFFRVTNERGEAYALAVREAAKEGFNPATREFRERVAELAANPTDKMQEQIDAAGERFTFNAPLGEKGRAVQQTIKKLHIEWAVPFVQTPANVAKEMMRLTPAAPIVGEWRADIAKGGAAADKAIAEMVIGTAVGVTVFSLALSGNISGQGDPDPKKRATQMASGWQPYSIKIGDTWYSYQRLQPVGTLIGMAADAAAVWDHMGEEESDKIPKILSTAFANAITNQTFLQGVTNLVNAISDPQRFGPKFVQNMAASVVPAVVGQTAQMMDPYQREVYSVLDAVQNRIPGARESLMPKRDPYGEPIVAKERLGEISPITASTESTDKVRTEAARLGVGVSKAPDSVHLPAGRDKKLGKIELTPEQRDIFADKAGHTAHQILSQMVGSPSWDAMPDMVQRQAMERVFEASRKMGQAAAVPPEQIIQKAREISDELQRRMQQK